MKLTFKRFGEVQPAQNRSVLLLLSDSGTSTETFESTAFLTEHSSAGWLWHFHDARFHPRQPDKDDWWAYYPRLPADVPQEV